MIEEKFNEILSVLGKPEAEVISALGLDPQTKDPIEDDSFWHTYSVQKGVDFVFDAQNSKFIEVHIQLKTATEEEVYSAPPPLGISSSWDRAQALAFLGSPTHSWPAKTLPVIGERGGCDSFSMEAYPDIELFVGYSTTWQVERMSLMHKDRPI